MRELGIFEDTDGVKISYEIYGKGRRTLLFMHGLLMDSNLNRRLAENLAAEGNRVILVDLPGHGRSDKPLRASDHRMDAYARRILHLMDALRLRSVVIGGMSLGAGVALQATGALALVEVTYKILAYYVFVYQYTAYFNH